MSNHIRAMAGVRPRDRLGKIGYSKDNIKNISNGTRYENG